jgi:hypothetical protein
MSVNISWEGVLMPCVSCGSRRQPEFLAELNIHFSGLKNLGKPGVLVFPKVLVCLDCGLSWFTTPKNELARLGDGTPESGFSYRERMLATSHAELDCA